MQPLPVVTRIIALHVFQHRHKNSKPTILIMSSECTCKPNQYAISIFCDTHNCRIRKNETITFYISNKQTHFLHISQNPTRLMKHYISSVTFAVNKFPYKKSKSETICTNYIVHCPK
jgi:hypothetical protein